MERISSFWNRLGRKESSIWYLMLVCFVTGICAVSLLDFFFHQSLFGDAPDMAPASSVDSPLNRNDMTKAAADAAKKNKDASVLTSSVLRDPSL